MDILDEKDGSRDAKFSLEKTEMGFYTRKQFDVVYLVLTDTVNDTEDDVRALFADLGSVRNNAFLKEVNPKEITTVRHPETGVLATLYEVSLSYDSKFDSEQDDDNPKQVNPDDPTDTRPDRRTYVEKEDEVLERDAISGSPIETYNGERIILTHPVSTLVLEITRYEPDVIDTLWVFKDLIYLNHTNEEEFYGAPPGHAVMDDISREEVVITGTNNQKRVWLRVTYKIKFKIKLYQEGSTDSGGFIARPLHEGFMVRQTPDAAPELNLDPKTKMPVRTNLAQNGTILAEGAEPIYLEFNRFPTTSFAPLGLEY